MEPTSILHRAGYSFLLSLLLSCAQVDPDSCLPGAAGCPTGTRCGTNDDCAAEPGQQICDVRSQKCRGCVVHAECPSGACRYEATLPDLVPVGQCLPADQLALVDGNRCFAADADGSPRRPYCEVQEAISARRPIVIVRPREHSTPYRAISVTSGKVTVIGPWREAEPQAVLAGVTISGGDTSATFIDLAMQATDAAAISCREGALQLIRAEVGYSREGIVATNGCRLTIERSRVTGNERAAIRTGPGTRHRIVNSLLIDNGRTFTPDDRLNLTDVAIDLGSNLEGNVFSFNTLIGNGGAVNCRAGQVVKNSIVAQKGAAPFRNDSCVQQQVFVGDEDAPRFDGRYALTRDSQCCIDRAVPDPTVTLDYDGSLRPQGEGYDIGAYELR